MLAYWKIPVYIWWDNAGQSRLWYVCPSSTSHPQRTGRAPHTWLLWTARASSSCAGFTVLQMGCEFGFSSQHCLFNHSCCLLNTNQGDSKFSLTDKQLFYRLLRLQAHTLEMLFTKCNTPFYNQPWVPELTAYPPHVSLSCDSLLQIQPYKSVDDSASCFSPLWKLVKR